MQSEAVGPDFLITIVVVVGGSPFPEPPTTSGTVPSALRALYPLSLSASRGSPLFLTLCKECTSKRPRELATHGPRATKLKTRDLNPGRSRSGVHVMIMTVFPDTCLMGKFQPPNQHQGSVHASFPHQAPLGCGCL